MQQRSQKKKQVEVDGNMQTTIKESAPRRLAPQRKRKTTAIQSPPQSSSSLDVSLNTTSTTNDDINNQKVQVQNYIIPANNLPINISGSEEDDEDYNDDHKIGVADYLLNERTITNEEEGGNGIAKNIADWTTLDDQNFYNTKKECTVAIDEHDAYTEEHEKEYHGEIESTCSNSPPPDNNVLGTEDELDSQGQINDDEETIHDDDDIFHIITEDQISLYPPPPSRPLVLVNLVELCGCPPEDEDEKSILVSQLMEALLGNKEEEEEEQVDIDENKEGDVVIKEEKEDGTNKSNGILGDGLSLDFDERMIELFESGVASHVDSSYPIAISCLDDEEEEGKKKNTTTNQQTVTPYAVVQYPEFLSDHQQSSSARSTMRLWKLLYTVPTQDEHINPLLSKIFTHLRNTSRSLLWKADMHYELSILSKKEYTLQIQRTQLKEYNAWKETVRRERLDKLYEVRETFLVRVEVAKKKFDALADEREGRVDRELRRRGLLGEVKTTLHKENDTLLLQAGSSMGGEEYDNNSGYDDDDDGWGGTICEDDILGEETSIGRRQFDATVQDDEEYDNDEWAPLDTGVNPLGMNIALDGVKVANNKGNDANAKPKSERRKVANKTNKLEPISHDDNIKRKSDRMQKKQDQLGPTSSTEQRSEYLRREQETIRETLKTNDERIAEATLLKLEERLQKVDDLLESLQEEEWADEEDDEEGKVGNSLSYEVEDEKEAEGPILLDQILSMILGVLPKEKDASGIDIKTDEEHYKYLKEEHNSIVKEWKEVFGRLPPFPSAEPEVKPVESEKVDGDMSFGDAFVPSEAKFIVSQAEKPVVGNTSLTLKGNEDSNWDDVDDWDAVFP